MFRLIDLLIFGV